MFNSFSTALSALSAHSTAVDVVGNNLANMNTPGYKASAVYFRDLMAQSLGSGDTQVGFGAGVPLTMRHFTQGSIQPSTGLLDAAIRGDGFFVLRNAQSNMASYTRAGSFQMDRAGYLLSATGERVQGWTGLDANGQVNTSGAVGDILMPAGTLKAPQATTAFSVDLNLDASAAADATSRFSTPIEVYDSLGAAHVLTVNFEKTANHEWRYDVFIPGGEVDGGTAGELFAIPNATGTLTFDDAGRLTDPALGSPITIDIDGFTNGAQPLALTWNPYTPDGDARITQFAQPSTPSASSQNGSPSAQLVRVGLADGGRIVATYSDGQQLTFGQLAVASMRNPDSLTAIGNNSFILGADSAMPVIGVPGSGGRGEVIGNAMEQSTVDIAREFTNLIMLQRGYQANSRVVNTVDELSQETINLKR
jgi:flagellar hook protein FlgE